MASLYPSYIFCPCPSHHSTHYFVLLTRRLGVWKRITRTFDYSKGELVSALQRSCCPNPCTESKPRVPTYPFHGNQYSSSQKQENQIDSCLEVKINTPVNSMSTYKTPFTFQYSTWSEQMLTLL